MSNQIVSLIASYPLGRGYTWDIAKPSSGVTRDLVYQGTTILKADKATYCCGLCFELWFLGYGVHLTIPVSEMRQIQRQFYNSAGNRRGAVDALVPRGLATIVMLDQAQEGDLLQLWRASGSGHSVIYRKHDTNTLTYFSTQKATSGLGNRTEMRKTLIELHFCRPKLIV